MFRDTDRLCGLLVVNYSHWVNPPVTSAPLLFLALLQKMKGVRETERQRDRDTEEQRDIETERIQNKYPLRNIGSQITMGIH